MRTHETFEGSGRRETTIRARAGSRVSAVLSGTVFLRAVLLGTVISVVIATAGALRAENVITMGHGEGRPGQNDIDVIVTASNDAEIHGYSIAFTYPGDILTLSEVSTIGTHVDEVNPDFVAPSRNGQLGIGGLAVIFSFTEPVTLKELPATPFPGYPRIIARLTFSVKPDAVGGNYPIELKDGIGTPASYNRFSNRGTSIAPRLVQGSFFVNGGGNVLLLEKKIAFPGATSNLPIYAYCAHPDPLGGFQIAVRYDKTALTLKTATFAGTSLDFELGASQIELYSFDHTPNFSATHGRGTAAAVFDYIDPRPGGQTLPPSTDSPPTQSLMKFSFDVGATADDEKQYQELILDDTNIPGLIDNRLIVGDRSLDPDLVHGMIYFSQGDLIGRAVDAVTGDGVGGMRVATEPDGHETTTLGNGAFRLAGIPPGRYSLIISGPDHYTSRADLNPDTGEEIHVFGSGTDSSAGDIPIYRVPDGTAAPKRFLRGFVNEDGRLDLSDAVFLLVYLFRGGERPPCLLASDMNDDNRLDISDAVFTLNFLFTGGGRPPEPLAEVHGGNGCDFDPTPGGVLTCNTFEACP